MEQPETLDAARAILHGHREVFFGLCAWVFDQRLEDAAVEEYHAVLRAHLPAGLRCLTALWLSAEEDRSWHWDRWEMTDSEEVQVLDFGRKLRQVYVAQALWILAGMPDTERAAVTVESSRELAVTARDDGPLTRLLDQVESAPDDWSNLLTTAEASSVDALRRILLHARSAHEETERVSLRAASIDPGKVGGFIARFLEEVNGSASVRQLLRIHDATQDTSSAPLAEGAGKGWRTASLTPKHAFVDMEGMVFGSLGGQVGHDLAVRENATLLTEMVTGLRPHEVDSETQIPGEVADLIGDSDWQNPVLIMTFDPDNHGHAFWDSDVAVRRWKEPTEHSKHADLDSYEGFVQCGDVRVPVFQVFVPDWSDAQGTFLLVSLSSLGVLTQHMPLEREEDDEYVHDRFCIRVQDLNADDEERARMLADQSPRPDNGSDADREDRLREQVLVTIRQKFAFVTRDASAGVRLVVAGQGQSDGEAPA